MLSLTPCCRPQAFVEVDGVLQALFPDLLDTLGVATVTEALADADDLREALRSMPQATGKATVNAAGVMVQFSP